MDTGGQQRTSQGEGGVVSARCSGEASPGRGCHGDHGPSSPSVQSVWEWGHLRSHAQLSPGAGAVQVRGLALAFQVTKVPGEKRKDLLLSDARVQIQWSGSPCPQGGLQCREEAAQGSDKREPAGVCPLARERESKDRKHEGLKTHRTIPAWAPDCAGQRASFQNVEAHGGNYCPV